MSATPRTQAFLLTALVGVLAVVIAYQFWGGSPAATGPAASNPLPPGTSMAAGTEPVSHVRLDLLSKDAPAYTPPQRNPFRFRVRPAPVVRQPVAPPPVFVAPPPPPPPGPPPIRIRYVGSFIKADLGLVVMLKDEATGLAHTSQAGQVVDGRYRLLSATYDAVEIAHLDGRGRQRIARER